MSCSALFFGLDTYISICSFFSCAFKQCFLLCHAHFFSSFHSAFEPQMAICILSTISIHLHHTFECVNLMQYVTDVDTWRTAEIRCSVYICLSNNTNNIIIYEISNIRKYKIHLLGAKKNTGQNWSTCNCNSLEICKTFM